MRLLLTGVPAMAVVMLMAWLTFTFSGCNDSTAQEASPKTMDSLSVCPIKIKEGVSKKEADPNLKQQRGEKENWVIRSSGLSVGLPIQL